MSEGDPKEDLGAPAEGEDPQPGETGESVEPTGDPTGEAVEGEEGKEGAEGEEGKDEIAKEEEPPKPEETEEEKEARLEAEAAALAEEQRKQAELVKKAAEEKRRKEEEERRRIEMEARRIAKDEKIKKKQDKKGKINEKLEKKGGKVKKKTDKKKSKKVKKEKKKSKSKKKEKYSEFFEQLKMLKQNKIVQSLIFKYWALLTKTEKDEVPPEQIINLIHRIYKVLVPRYNYQFYEEAFYEEYLYYCDEKPNMNYEEFFNLMFSIVHMWTQNVDIFEYCGILKQIYSRITATRHNLVSDVTKSTEPHIEIPKISLSFPTLEQEVNEKVLGPEDMTGWEVCQEEEPEIEAYYYSWKNSNRYKKKKDKKDKKQQKKDKFLGIGYDERVLEEDNIYDEGNIVGCTDRVFLPIHDIIPMGYLAECFLLELKNREEGVEYEYDYDPYKIGIKNKLGNNTIMEGLVIYGENGRSWEGLCTVNIGATTLKVLQDKVRKMNTLETYMIPFKITPEKSGRGGAQGFVGTNSTKLYNEGLYRTILMEKHNIGGVERYINTNYTLKQIAVQEILNSCLERLPPASLTLKREEMGKSSNIPFPYDIPFSLMKQRIMHSKFTSIKKQMKKFKAEKKRKMEESGVDLLIEDGDVEEISVKDALFPLKSDLPIMKDDFISDFIPIYAANTPALKILITGPPRCGKTSLASELCKILGLVHIEVEVLIGKLLHKIETYEPPDDLEEGQEPPKYLSELEEEIHKCLMQGKEVSDRQMVYLLREALQTEEAELKGYVLDLPYTTRKSKPWLELLHPKGLPLSPNDFSYVICLELSRADIFGRAEKIRYDPINGGVFSKWERLERLKPRERKKKVEEEGDEEEEEEEELDPEEEENRPKPFQEMGLVQRVTDTEEIIDMELTNWKCRERPALENILEQMTYSKQIHISEGGLSPSQITESVIGKIRERSPLRPLPILLEGEGDIKSLLTQGLEENEVPRKWSIWQQTDPVALYKGKVDVGVGEFPASYAHHVFLFSGEENQKEFMNTPGKFLHKPPFMPGEFRLALLGPRGSGKRTMATRLSEKYGWKVVDLLKLYEDKLQFQREQAKTQLLVNNPEINTCQFTKEEFGNIIGGKQMDRKDTLAFGIEYLGFNVEKKRPPKPEEEEGEEEKVAEVVPAEEEGDEEGEEGENVEGEEVKEPSIHEPELLVVEDIFDDDFDRVEVEEEDINIIEGGEGVEGEEGAEGEEGEGAEGEGEEGEIEGEAELQSPPEPKIDTSLLSGKELDQSKISQRSSKGGKEEEKEEEEEEEIIYDDIPIADIVTALDENEKPPLINGYIFVGFPETEEECNRLKEFFIDFDKIVFLVDGNEEEAGEEMRRRRADDPFYNHEGEVEFIANAKVAITEAFGEEKVTESPYNGGADTVFYKLCSTIDPFFVQIDDAGNVRTSGEIDEEERPLPKGESGDFCPITLCKENWLQPGDPETEVQVKQKTYRISGEKEMEEFRINPMLYITESPTEPPPPHIMITGVRGAGATTQLHKIGCKYNIDVVQVKDTFLRRLEEEKGKRKRGRYLARGFKAPEPLGDDDEATEEVPEDPEIAEDPEDFDRGAEERGILKEIMLGGLPQLYNGEWFDMPEDKVSLPFLDIMSESRRLPEVIVILQLTQKRMLERLLNKPKINIEYEMLVAKRKAEKEAEKEARKVEKEEEKKRKMEEEGEDYVEEEEVEEVEEEEEEDPDAPDLEKMLEEAKEKLNETYDTQNAYIEEFTENVKAKHVKVILLNGDVSREQVFNKICYNLKSHFEMRQNILEKEKAYPIKPTEVPFFEKSYVYAKSIFGEFSPVYMNSACVNKQYAAVYRDKLYYLTQEEEQQSFLAEPLKYVCQKAVPLDIAYRPTAFLLGLPRAGTTRIAKRIEEVMGCIHLKITDIIKLFMDADCTLCEKMRELLGQGSGISDEIIVQLVQKRIQMIDCIEKGWVLDGFPTNARQANILCKLGIVPDYVFMLEIPPILAVQRTLAKSKTPESSAKFGNDMRVLRRRIGYTNENMGNIVGLYTRKYANVRLLDGKKSVWNVEFKIKKFFEEVIENKQQYARRYILGVPRKVDLLKVEREHYNHELSEFRTFSPIAWKMNGLLKRNRHRKPFVMEYNNHYYFLSSDKEAGLFEEHYKKIFEGTTLPDELPTRIGFFECAEKIAQPTAKDSKKKSKKTKKSAEFELQGFCPTCLYKTRNKKLSVGDPLRKVKYCMKYYIFDKEECIDDFTLRPNVVSQATLPIKLPPEEKKVELAYLASLQDSITFLEDSLGSVITKGLLEIGSNRMKYPTLSVEETALKMLALYLKANNPNNSQYVKQKYQRKIQEFSRKCEFSSLLYHETKRKESVMKSKMDWEPYEEKYLAELGNQYDNMVTEATENKKDNFTGYFR